MPYSHIVGTQKRYRITLDLSVESDFNPRDIDWRKVFKLEPAEQCDSYIEELSASDRTY